MTACFYYISRLTAQVHPIPQLVKLSTKSEVEIKNKKIRPFSCNADIHGLLVPVFGSQLLSPLLSVIFSQVLLAKKNGAK